MGKSIDWRADSLVGRGENCQERCWLLMMLGMYIGMGFITTKRGKQGCLARQTISIPFQFRSFQYYYYYYYYVHPVSHSHTLHMDKIIIKSGLLCMSMQRVKRLHVLYSLRTRVVVYTFNYITLRNAIKRGGFLILDRTVSDTQTRGVVGLKIYLACKLNRRAAAWTNEW